MFTTKQRLSNEKFYQGVTDQLSITGNTYIPKFSGDTTSFKFKGIDINNYTFGTGGGFAGATYDIKLQSSGKLIVVGSFVGYSGSTLAVPNMVRLNTDGTLDTTFTPADANGTIYNLIVQPDDKYIIIGEFTLVSGANRNFIARLNSDGSLDTTFETGSGFDSQVYSAIALQSDNKVLVGGDFTTYSGVTRNRIIRLHPNGKVDATFTIGSGFDGFVLDIIPQSDGKIMVSGLFTDYNGTAVNGLVRLNSNGTVDNTFQTSSGFDIGGGQYALRIARQTDGKYVAIGVFTSYSGVTANGIIRLNSNGTIDNSFDSGLGIEGGSTSPSRILIESSGKIVVGGDFTTVNGLNYPYFVRFNSNGSVDTTLEVENGFNNIVHGFHPTGNSYYVIGDFTQYKNVPSQGIIKISNTGKNETGDSSILFKNSVAQYDTTYSASKLRANSLAPKSYVDNYIKASNGITKTGEQLELGGALSKQINISGDGILSERIQRLLLQNAYNQGFEISSKYYAHTLVNDVVDYSSNIYAFTNNSTLIYDDNKLQSIDATVTGVTCALVVAGGFLYVGGTFTRIGGQLSNKFVRFASSSLSPDVTFNIGSGFNGSVNAIAVHTGNKVIVGGSFTQFNGMTQNRLVRLNTNGTIDSTFNIGSGFGDGSVNKIHVQADGKILVGGTFTLFTGTTTNRIIRLNSDGTRDTSFVIGTGFNSGAVNALTTQADDKVLVGGTFASYSGVTLNKIVRLHPNGKVDATFVTGLLAGPGLTVNAIYVEPSGKIVAGGQWTSYTGSSLGKIIKFNTNGSRDTSFPGGTGFAGGSFITSNGIKQIKSFVSGKYFIVGDFTAYNGVSTNRIIEISTGGTQTQYDIDIIKATDPIVYNTDLSSQFKARSIPDVAYITGRTNQVELILITTSPYSAETHTHFIHVSGGSIVNISLPQTPKLNQQICVSDAKGTANVDNIIIHGSGKLINGASTAILDTSYGTLMFVYNGVNWVGGAFTS